MFSDSMRYVIWTLLGMPHELPIVYALVLALQAPIFTMSTPLDNLPFVGFAERFLVWTGSDTTYELNPPGKRIEKKKRRMMHATNPLRPVDSDRNIGRS
jgi:hypothetical protein